MQGRDARSVAESGSWIDYGPKLQYVLKRAATLGRVRRQEPEGARPQNLLIEQPTEFELVVDVKTAKEIGLKVPEAVLNRADQVIR